MELQITGKNLELSPTVKSYIERKMSKLNRHLTHIIETKVEITEEKTKSPQQHFVAQITINSSGTLLRGEERGEDLFIAIDKAVAVVDRQIAHYKGKLYKKGRGSSPVRGEANLTAERAPRQRVIKVKRFAITPLPLEEAIDQMELLGHDFFLFLNAETGELNLVYRRRDSDYGLIQPELK
jgi:putative sigma-54 modulation protein